MVQWVRLAHVKVKDGAEYAQMAAASMAEAYVADGSDVVEAEKNKIMRAKAYLPIDDLGGGQQKRNDPQAA